ncbi:MAG: hypothetical protein M1838_003211 [Thelocarpon superellum]|nr:MAG: hypothetical protein M1838_003211 [Thelocarpon superellum]
MANTVGDQDEGRARKRGRSFFSRLTTLNLWTPMLKDCNQDVDLSFQQADNLFRWQLASEHSRQLNELSCFMCSIVESKYQSREAYKGLLQAGVLCPGRGDLDTTRIDKNFTHHLATIPLFRQRKIIGMLFHWEEELTRWRLLDEEESEIRQVMQAVGFDDENCVVGLAAIACKRRLALSERVEQTSQAEPPGYATAVEQGARQVNSRSHSPPTDTLAACPTSLSDQG